MQGRHDVPLSAAGRTELALWRVPPPMVAAKCWYSSPLARAVETAAVLASRAPCIAPALVEMDWGQWEGATLAALRERHGSAFTRAEARGLDFRPPAGESPRDVLARVRSWLSELAHEDAAVVAVTHNGVLRALLAAATGWDMIDRAPFKLRPGCVHQFRIDGDGGLAVVACNMPLAGASTEDA